MSPFHHKYLSRSSRLLLVSRMCSIFTLLRSYSHGKLTSSFIYTKSSNRFQRSQLNMFHRTSLNLNAKFDFFDEEEDSNNSKEYEKDNIDSFGNQNAKFDFFDEENDYKYPIQNRNNDNEKDVNETKLDTESSIKSRNAMFGNILYDTGTKSTESDYPRYNDSFDYPKQTFTAQVTQSTMDFLKRSSSGYGSSSSSIEYLLEQLSKVEEEIYALNNGIKFNVNSPKQVASVLFGESSSSESTNKDVLEALAGTGNQIASKVLLYRNIKANIKRNKYKQERIEYRKKEQIENNENQRNGKRDPLVLVDASAYIFRAYFSMPPLHRNDGTPVGAVLGVCKMIDRLVLTRLMQGDTPRFVLVFDGVRKGKSFRHELYEDYKANRPPCPMDLVPQFDLVRDAAIAYGIPCLEADGYEADDVIATLATMALKDGVDVDVYSSDKDLMQLVTPSNLEPSLKMIDPMKMDRVISDVEVQNKWGVTPEQLGDVLALAGDSSDNIPGVPGIGPKIAATLINEYGSLDKLLDNLDSIKQKGRREKLISNVENARLSRQLVELERSIPKDLLNMPSQDFSEFKMEVMNEDRILKLYDNMEFFDLKRRFQKKMELMKN